PRVQGATNTGETKVLKKTDDRLYPEQEDGGSPIKSVLASRGTDDSLDNRVGGGSTGGLGAIRLVISSEDYLSIIFLPRDVLISLPLYLKMY
ncbi:hypothetical protein U9M48_035922, partial [Paspalum notatum var. saurae]